MKTISLFCVFAAIVLLGIYATAIETWYGVMIWSFVTAFVAYVIFYSGGAPIAPSKAYAALEATVFIGILLSAPVATLAFALGMPPTTAFISSATLQALLIIVLLICDSRVRASERLRSRGQ